jgi:hypothetical protein
VNFLKINEMKKAHQAGGRAVYTWQKQPQDKVANLIGIGLVTIGMIQLVPAFYRLSTGKGKMD